MILVLTHKRLSSQKFKCEAYLDNELLHLHDNSPVASAINAMQDEVRRRMRPVLSEQICSLVEMLVIQQLGTIMESYP